MVTRTIYIHVHTTSIGPTNQCSRTLANRAICIVSPPPSPLIFTLLLVSVHHICIVTLPYLHVHTTSISLTNQCLYIALLLLFSIVFLLLFYFFTYLHKHTPFFSHYWLEPVSKHFTVRSTPVVFGARDK